MSEVLLGNLLDHKNDANLNIHEFIVNGIGDQISFHVCDEKPALIGSDFAITDIGENRHVYSKVLKVGPARLRLHWAWIGRKIYLASQLELMARLPKESRLFNGFSKSVRSVEELQKQRRFSVTRRST